MSEGTSLPTEMAKTSGRPANASTAWLTAVLAAVRTVRWLRVDASVCIRQSG